ncbi:MAG: tRNA lysidine(34) synthetase TilS [Oscillospiraceae bacterium]|nr:tRNA lysidine(34) synthetase TilS [Oscillospiraceae bacterium]
MKTELLASCRREQLFTAGDRVIAAVSGGADSMAMLWCLHSFRAELGITVSAAHFNHGIRGAEADEDEAFVRAFCEAHGIEFCAGRADVAPFAKESGMTLEEAAREKRYGFLLSLPGDKIATAHNADDNAETVLLHLLRGSGLRGLCGIPPRRGKIVRPMLSVSREEILQFLNEENIPWREDRTNGEDDCLRNRLRHHVMPLLYEEAPFLRRNLLRRCELLRSEDDLLDKLAGELLKPEGDGYRIAPILSAADPLQKRALRLILREHLPQNAAQRHIDALQRLVHSDDPSAQLDLPNGLTARRRYDVLLIQKDGELPSFPETALNVPGVTRIPHLRLRVVCAVEENFQKQGNTAFQFAVKYDMIATDVLTLRPRRTGDRMQMDGGYTKTLKKLLIEQRIPRDRREALPVLTDGKRVLAVLGLGVSADCRAEERQRALVITTETED